MRTLLPGGVIGQAADDHLRSGGSRTRARFALAAGEALALLANDRLAIAAGCELLHNASLVHDDLHDGDAARRGRPSVWAAHGSAVAVCAGDALLSAAYAALAGAPDGARLVAHAHRAVARVIEGQGRDLAMKGGAALTADAYDAMARAKAGPLFSLPFELPLLAAGKAGALKTARTAAEDFALAYQIADDLTDAGSDAAKGEANLVAILKTSGAPDPAAAARRLAAVLDAGHRERVA